MQVAQCWSSRGRQLELSRDQFNVPMNGQKKSSLMAALIDQADPREGASRPHRRIGVEAFGRGVPPSPQGQRTNDKFRTIWNETLSVIDSDDEPSVRPTGGQNVVTRISSGDAIVATVPASPATLEAAGRRCADVHSFVVIHDEGVPSAVPCQPSQSPFGSIGMLMNVLCLRRSAKNMSSAFFASSGAKERQFSIAIRVDVLRLPFLGGF